MPSVTPDDLCSGRRVDLLLTDGSEAIDHTYRANIIPWENTFFKLAPTPVLNSLDLYLSFLMV